MALVVMMMLILKDGTESVHGFGTTLLYSSLVSVAQCCSKPRQEATKA
jgi:hypothetical protein